MRHVVWGTLLTLAACGGTADDTPKAHKNALVADGPDADGDGLSDADEARLGTNPNEPDTDKDGKKDGAEVHQFKTNPLAKDSDGDGVADGQEIKEGTDPLKADATPKEGNNGGGSASGAIVPGETRIPAIADTMPEEWSCERKRPAFWIVQLSCFNKIAGGSFLMGAQKADPAGPGYDAHAEPNEAPPHTVTVAPFWIQRHEVSAVLYRECVTSGWCKEADVLTDHALSTLKDPALDHRPINGVTWDGAQRLCSWLGGRLPTEAEWEFAARGTEGRTFPWGQDVGCGHAPQWTPDGVGGPPPETCEGAVMKNVDDSAMRTPEVTIWLGGNVWEWVGDWYAEPYAAGAATDPTGPTSGTHRVQRGGSFMSATPWELRSAARAAVPPDQKLPDVGFRCAWTGRP